MKGYIFLPIFIVGGVIAYVVYSQFLPEHIRAGGPLVMGLILLLYLVFVFIVERFITLSRAQGRGDVGAFMRNLRNNVHNGDLKGAVEVCRRQGGCLANVVGAGLERYQQLQGSNLDKDELIEETKRTIGEANALETPILERNLIALATIASIATMVGLLGTVIGMIRSFAAMSNAGAPDASQLALGISEALVNTAGGIGIAIVSIIVYNYFTNRVDSFNYMLDETTYEVLQELQREKKKA